MFRCRPEITFLQLVLIAEVGITVILMSFYDKQNCRTEEAGWTLTRQAILSARSSACKLDQRICLHIRALGCAARRRGSRGGQRKVKLKAISYTSVCFVTGVQPRSVDYPSAIPVITGNRPLPSAQEVHRAARSTRRHGHREPRDVVRRQLQRTDDGRARQVTSQHQVTNCLPALYLLNPTSLAKPLALQQLSTDLIAYNIDIAVITETWFKSRHTDQAVPIPGYNIFRRDRPKRRGGGVAIYARTNINAKPCALTPLDPRIELLWVQLFFNNKSIVIGVLYHPPKPLYSASELIQEIERSIELIVNSSMNTMVILAGDFNQLPDTAMKHLGFHGIFLGPSHAGHCLDRIYATEPAYTNSKSVISTINTAHRAVIASDNVHIDINKKRTARQYRPR